MCRGTAFIAASTTSSRMPCSRRRSTIRVRVRADVMPMPDSLAAEGSHRLSRPGPPQAPRSQSATVASWSWWVRSICSGVTET